MRLIFLQLLCFVAYGAAFMAKVTPSAASKSGLRRQDDGPKSSSSAISGRRPSGRRPLFPQALRVRPVDEGGDDKPGDNSTEIRVVDKKVEAVEEDIKAVGREIGSVGKKIEAVEAALSGGPPYLGITDRDLLLKEDDWLQKEKEQLQKEREQLRGKEAQLRQEKLLLLKNPPAPAVSPAGTYEV